MFYATQNRLTAPALVVLTIYGVVLFVLAWFHTIGQDEAQAWNIAAASQYPWDVLIHGEKEGHTPLWHIFLWFLLPFSVDAVPYATACFALIFGFLLLRDRPFPLWICSLLIFGYFTLYDYPTIPRPYIIAMLFASLYASALYNRCHNLIYLSLLLSMVAFSSAFGVLLSVPLGVLGLTILWQDGWRPTFSKALVASVSIYVVTLVAAFYFIVFPLATNEYAVNIVTGGRAWEKDVAQAVLSSVFPHFIQLPLGIGGWLSSTEPGGLVVRIMCVLVVAATCLLLFSLRTGLLAWVVAILIISVGAKYSGTGIVRHLGHLYIAAFAIVWVAMRSGPVFRNIALKRVVKVGIAPVLIGVLFYHALLGLAGVYLSVKTPQATGRILANYLEQHIAAPQLLITNNTHDIGHVMAYLDIEVFDTVCGCWQRSADMSKSRKWDPVVLQEQWCHLYGAEKVEYALISTEDELPMDSRFRMLKQFMPLTRDNTDGPLQLWELTQQGVEQCKS